MNSAEQNQLASMDRKIALKMKKEIQQQKIHILSPEELQHFEKRKKHVIRILEKII